MLSGARTTSASRSFSSIILLTRFHFSSSFEYAFISSTALLPIPRELFPPNQPVQRRMQRRRSPASGGLARNRTAQKLHLRRLPVLHVIKHRRRVIRFRANPVHLPRI